MFEQFMPPKQSLLKRLSRWFLLSGLALSLLINPALIRGAFGFPDRIRGLLMGVAFGLTTAALTLHLAAKRQSKPRDTATSAG